LNKKYELKEVLGVGSTSTCHKCVERVTGEECACKIIDKQEMEIRFKGMMEQFQTEIRVLRNLHHPNIIHLKDVYITKEKIFIVMELMSGGELFDYVVEKGTLTEEEASQIIRRVTSALVYMHKKNIIHRDLKPENLLLTHKPRSPGEVPEVKIIDFGLSKLMQEQPVASSFLGTRGYLAPEMLQRQKYTRAVDAWALGVITYVLLCGCLPFDDDSASIPTDAMLRSKFVLRFPRWAKNLSPSARDLLSRLLDINPRSRYTAEQALQHVSPCLM
jgi:serine/threonine protein kinase